MESDPAGGMANNGLEAGYWGMSDPPRIRSITGVRIRQLTLPEALASSLSRAGHTTPPVQDGYFLGESSYTASSPSQTPQLRRASSSASHGPSRWGRRISLSELEEPQRARADSGSTLRAVHAASGSGSQTARERTTRPRSRTLAGEAIEQAQQLSHSLIEANGDSGIGDGDAEAVLPRRQLARCFIAFKLPAEHASTGTRTDVNGPAGLDVKGKGRAPDSDMPSQCPSPLRRNPSLIKTRPSRSTSMDHLPGPSSPTSPSSNPGTPPRSRTTSLNTNTSPAVSKSGPGPPSTPDAAGQLPKLGQRPPRLVRAGSEAGRSRPPGRPVSMISRGSYRSPHLNSATESGPDPPVIPDSLMPKPSPSAVAPFFLSPIHPPSSHPAFPALLPESDFAAWLTTAELATQVVDVEVWYEDPERGWAVLNDVGGRVDLSSLRPVRNGGEGENDLEFSLKGDTGGWYSIRLDEAGERVGGDPKSEDKGRKRGASVRGVMERSVRETRMKKGVGVGGLHQLVHGQSVVEDTKQNIEIVKSKIDDLLRQDADRRALRRDVDQRTEKDNWIQSKIDEIDRIAREVDAAIVLRKKAISDRRQALARAEERDDAERSRAVQIDQAIHTAQMSRAALQPLIHHYRAHHVQTLDALFPILPLSPSILLYGILGVPLPIPSGKDPAPPITLPAAILPDGVKVDERTTAAALGYVTMVVHILGNLGGTGPGGGGLVYPVTCAGSRSLVRDVVSVMQGPRSFPLYTKGVERYRFDYAVFLLNTNIELLMQEANIRLVDRRHTLPNLKSLLLTLSSPTPPPPPPHPAGQASSYPPSGTTTYNNSRIGSRQASYTFNPQLGFSTREKQSVLGSPASSLGDLRSPPGSHIGGVGRRERDGNSMSPIKAGWGDGGARGRSHLSRQSWGGSQEAEEGDGETAVSRSEVTSELGTGYDH